MAVYGFIVLSKAIVQIGRMIFALKSRVRPTLKLRSADPLSVSGGATERGSLGTVSPVRLPLLRGPEHQHQQHVRYLRRC